MNASAAKTSRDRRVDIARSADPMRDHSEAPPPGSSRWLRAIVLCACVLLAGATLQPGAAEACGNTVAPYRIAHPAIADLLTAEEAVRREGWLTAAEILWKRYPAALSDGPASGREADRARRTAAILLSRTRGAGVRCEALRVFTFPHRRPLDPELGPQALNEWLQDTQKPGYDQGVYWIVDPAIMKSRFGALREPQRLANLAWALDVLRKRAESSHPIALTDLAEAQSFEAPAEREAAKATLERLAADDLITSARGWAALSRLRRASRDLAGADAAVTRCQRMRPGFDCENEPRPCPVPR